ncbi:MAG: hypothetical protein WCY59_06110 [Anaerovoracaceae bacterium]
MINFLATFAYYFQLFIIGMTTLCGSLLIILVLLINEKDREIERLKADLDGFIHGGL